MTRWQWALVVAWLALTAWMLVNSDVVCRDVVTCVDSPRGGYACGSQLVCE